MAQAVACADAKAFLISPFVGRITGPLEPIKKRAPEEARFSVSKDLVFSIFYRTPERLIGQIEQQGQKAWKRGM